MLDSGPAMIRFLDIAVVVVPTRFTIYETLASLS